VKPGVTIVDPEVGELVTSFDMAGLSLTLCWLDDELEELWKAPADTPAVRKGNVNADQATAVEVAVAAGPQIPAATPESQYAAGRVLLALQAIRDVVELNADELGRIDAVAGDGDHGIGMQRGSRAAYEAAAAAVNAGAGAGSTLAIAADEWADRAGGTSGALWGLMLRTLGRRLGDDTVPTAAEVAIGVHEAVDAVRSFGKAQIGDKTMIDVLVPFEETLNAETGNGLGAAWQTATARAESAAAATAQLVPKIGPGPAARRA